MAQSLFLSTDQVIRIHADMIRRYGGSPVLLNRGLLESAVAMPMQQFGGQYLHPDRHSQAAAYLYHLVKNHAFEDGNKRVGAASAVVFLLLNAAEIRFSEDQLVDVSLQVANDLISKDQLTEFFRIYVSFST